MKIIFDYNRTLFNPEAQEFFPSVFELLKELSEKHELFLVSALEPGRQEKIEEFGLTSFFKKVVFVEKKSVEIFKELMGKSGGVIVVGDRVRAEIKIGNELNYVTVWVRQGKFKDEEPAHEKEIPSHIVSDLLQIRNIIKKYESK